MTQKNGYRSVPHIKPAPQTVFSGCKGRRSPIPSAFPPLLVLLIGLALAGCVSLPAPLTPEPPPPDLPAPAATTDPAAVEPAGSQEVLAPGPSVEPAAEIPSTGPLTPMLALEMVGTSDWTIAEISEATHTAITTPLTLLAALPAVETDSKPPADAMAKAGPSPAARAASVLKHEMATSRTATLTVENESSRTVCHLYISLTTSSSWGDDWLEDGKIVRPGATRRFTLAAGDYDAQALDCDGEILAEVYGGTISGRTTWTITDDEEAPEEEDQPAPQPARSTAVRAVALDRFLCCGRTAGETRIWGISYPSGWEVTLMPENPDYFLAAMFVDPASTMRVMIAPSAWTPQGTIMDTGDVDEYLDGLTATRQQQHPGFKEFYRRPMAGTPARVWAGTWKEKGLQYWESYTAMVTPMPYVQGMPRGALMLQGLSAESSEWAQASDIYERMLGSIQVTIIKSGPAYVAPQAGPSDDPVEQEAGETGRGATTFWELVFCARKCDWEWIDLNSLPAGHAWECSDGCIGQLSKVECTEFWCR